MIFFINSFFNYFYHRGGAIWRAGWKGRFCNSQIFSSLIFTRFQVLQLEIFLGSIQLYIVKLNIILKVFVYNWAVSVCSKFSFCHSIKCTVYSMMAVVEFHDEAGEIDESLHLYEHTQRIFWYVLRPFDQGLPRTFFWISVQIF